MQLLFAFILGIANFALHKAVVSSGHPLLAQLPPALRGPGGRFGMALEFALLLGTMLMVANGGAQWVWAYLAYSAINALSAWLILTRRV